MKKTLLILTFVILALLPTIKKVVASENENFSTEAELEIHNERINTKTDSEKIPTKKDTYFSNKKSVDKSLKSIGQFTQKHIMSSGERFIASYSPELIINGSFESGQTAWTGSLKGFDGNYFDYPSIISASGDGYGSWYAYIMENELLESQPFTLPLNTNYLDILYSAKFVHWGTCSYGANGIYVFIWDETTNELVQNSLVHNAYTSPYDYSYYLESLLTTAPMSTRVGHKLSINFQGIKNDPGCLFALYLDNVSVVASKTDTCTGNNCNIYRFWSDSKQGHFFTKSEDEATGIIANDKSWRYEGVAYRALNSQVSENSPIYRFWSDSRQHHFYTVSLAERDSIIANDKSWRYEGVAYYAYASEQSNTTAVYRFWSDSRQGHFFTISAPEKDSIIANDKSWRYEGVAWYVPTN